MEGVQVDARGHNHDLLGPRPVMTTEFGCLVGGVGGKHVGRANDGRLPLLAYVGLDRLIATELGVLDASHGVHRVDERDALTALDLQTHLPGDPVMEINRLSWTRV